MEEVWRPLEYKDCDISDKYLISNRGRVYSNVSRKILRQTPN